jgi:hypothetical protein
MIRDAIFSALFIFILFSPSISSESTADTLPHATDFLTLPDGSGGTTWYPRASISERSAAIESLKKHGYTHIYLSITSGSHDYFDNPNGFRSLLEELVDEGIKPVVWITSDTGTWRTQSTSAIKSDLSTFIPQIDNLVNSYCMGIESDEYWTKTKTTEIGNYLDSLTSKPIAVHQLSGNYDYCVGFCDYLILQYGFGRTESEIRSITRSVISALGKPVVAGEYNIDRSKEELSILFGNAAVEEGAAGFGNGGGVSCIEEWNCQLWAECIEGMQYRTCLDINSCGTEVDKPFESRTCETNSAPIAKITNPSIDGSIAYNHSVFNFSGIVTDEDSDNLDYSWLIDRIGDGFTSAEIDSGTGYGTVAGSIVMSGEIQSTKGQTIDLEVIGATYRIILIVSDGNDEVEISRSFLLVGCEPDWDCELWSECLGGVQNRTCIDINSCGFSQDKPTETRACGMIDSLTAEINSPSSNGSIAYNGSVFSFSGNVSNKNSTNLNYSWLIDRIGDGFTSAEIDSGTGYGTVAGSIVMSGEIQSTKGQTIDLEVIGATYRIILIVSDGNDEVEISRSFLLAESGSDSYYCVSLDYVVSSIESWRSGVLSINDILGVVNRWKIGC